VEVGEVDQPLLLGAVQDRVEVPDPRRTEVEQRARRGGDR